MVLIFICNIVICFPTLCQGNLMNYWTKCSFLIFFTGNEDKQTKRPGEQGTDYIEDMLNSLHISFPYISIYQNMYLRSGHTCESALFFSEKTLVKVLYFFPRYHEKLLFSTNTHTYGGRLRGI